MTDPTLQRIRASREAISRRCDFDARKLVRFYQSRQDKDCRIKESLRRTACREQAAGYATR